MAIIEKLPLASVKTVHHAGGWSVVKPGTLQELAGGLFFKDEQGAEHFIPTGGLAKASTS